MEELDLHDVQGIVIRGYGNLQGAAYALLRITDPLAARRWLAGLAGSVTSALAHPHLQAINVAFTYEGLYQLGLRAYGFAPEFIEGMATPHRSRILGDAGLSAPEKWLWGAYPRNPGNDPVHVLVMLYARDADALGRLLDDARRDWQPGLTEVQILHAHPLPDRFGVKEHFGFRDGISQPAIAWDGVSPEAERRGVLRADRAENTVAPGEFIFGYRNEYGQLPAAPVVATDPTGFLPPVCGGARGFALGRNGTYLVFRQLRQLVHKFWAFARDQRGLEGGVHLASKMIGRWPSGAPLVMSPEYDAVGLEKYRGFDYARTDPHGHACPLGAHIRRANPRDALLTAGAPTESIKETKRHRLIRRGRTYGPPLVPSLDPVEMMQAPGDDVDDIEHGIERGLYFICVNSDIERQFEFIQHTWLDNPKFGGLYGHPDPLIGDRMGDFHSFFEQRAPVRRRYQGLASFVRTHGGAYFFLPGIQGLRYLGAMPVCPDA